MGIPAAHGGVRHQYIGAVQDGVLEANNVDGLLYQTVTLPAGTTSATLSYYLRIQSGETSTYPYDNLRVEIQNASGAVLLYAPYSNQNASQFSTWTLQSIDIGTYLNLSNYSGQQIRIAFHGTTDGSTATVFRLDDVSLQVTAPNATAPTVNTLAASLVTTTSAKMNASFNPNGSSTTTYFEYGTTTSYGTPTPASSGNVGSTLIPVAYSLTGLTPNTTYHYRVVAYNDVGTSRGIDASFTTLSTTNNLAGLQITGGIWPPSSAQVGATISRMSVDVYNYNVNGASGASNVKMYLSTDNQITRGDTELNFICNVPPLMDGGSFACPDTVTIPNVTPGVYWFGAIVDNGTTTGSIATALWSTEITAPNPQLPDLAVSSILALTSSTQSNFPLAFGAYVQNLGPVDSGQFSMKYYLSTSTTLTGSSIELIGNTPDCGLVPNLVYLEMRGVQCWGDILSVPTGNYYLIVVADPTNAITEITKTNNSRVSSSTVQITGSTYALSVNALPTAGGSVSGGGNYAANTSRTVTATANSGYIFSGWTGYASCASANPCTFTMPATPVNLTATFTANPLTYALSVSASPTAGGSVTGAGNYAANTSRTVTATANSGYTFSGWTGYASCSSQSICTFTMPAAAVNLTATFSSAALPDLVVTELIAPETGTAGGLIQIQARVANQGTASAAPYRLGFYFSTDAVITTSDTFSTYCSMPALAQAASWGCGGPASVPASLAPGAYYFGAIADDLGAVAESNEANNTRATAIVIINPLPPVCTLTAMPSRIRPGESTTLTTNCNPAANTYSWTGAGCAGKTTATCTVTPAVTTTYSVTGTNGLGSHTASTVVTVKNVVDLRG